MSQATRCSGWTRCVHPNPSPKHAAGRCSGRMRPLPRLGALADNPRKQCLLRSVNEQKHRAATARAGRPILARAAPSLAFRPLNGGSTPDSPGRRAAHDHGALLRAATHLSGTSYRPSAASRANPRGLAQTAAGLCPPPQVGPWAALRTATPSVRGPGPYTLACRSALGRLPPTLGRGPRGAAAERLAPKPTMFVGLVPRSRATGGGPAPTCCSGGLRPLNGFWPFRLPLSPC